MKNSITTVAMIALICVTLAGVTSATSDQYRCGNINLSEDGKITLSDITRLIDRVYISKQPLEIEEIGNVNGSLDHKLTLSDITYLISHTYMSGPDPDCACCIDRVTQAECLPPAEGADFQDETWYVEVIGSDIHLHHQTVYQCCLEYDVEFEIDGSQITAREYDLGHQCDCICPFTLESVLCFVDDGVYTLTLIDVFGDTVGTEVVTVPGNYMPITYEHGPCEENPGLSLAENIVYSYDGDVLLMEHFDAFFNCGFELRMRFELAADTIRFFELNISPDPMYCMCYYDISAEVAGILPGEYVAEVYAADGYLFGGPIVLVDRRQIQLGD